MYLCITRPYESRFSNIIELFNEFSILTCSHTFLALLNAAMPDQRIIMVGWFFIGVASLNVVTNVAITT